MEWFVNAVASLSVICCALLVGYRWPIIGPALAAALVLRLALLWARWSGFVVPNTQRDAGLFMDSASLWAQEGFLRAVAHFPGPTSYFYSWLLALPFSILGSYAQIAQAINVCFGLITVALSFELGRAVWNTRAGVVAAFVVALWPSGIWFSVSVLREPAQIAVVCYGCLCAVRWIKGDRLFEGLKATFALIFAGFLHGGLFAGVPLVLLVVAAVRLRGVRRHLRVAAFPATPLIAFGVGLSAIAIFVSGGVSLAKFGGIDDVGDTGYLEERLQRERGAATFPSFVTQQAGAGMFVMLPLRLVFFTGGPFLWNARSAEQLMGAVDGLLLLFLFGLVVANASTVWRNQSARAVFLLWIVLMLIFAAGTANFGTALRHRVKFAPELIALASPFLLRRSQRHDCPDTRSLATSSANSLNTSS
jgi:hypothetical protein